MLSRIRDRRNTTIGVKPSLESVVTIQRETEAEFDSLCEDVYYAIKEFGLEEQQGEALAASLFDLGMEMFTTGKVSRQMAMSLESISPDLINDRYPINSYTLHPSRTNLSVAMEAAFKGRNVLIGGLVAGILFLLVKIFGKLGETGAGTASNGAAIASSAKPLVDAAKAAETLSKNPTVADRINELMKEDTYINKLEKYKAHYTKSMDVLAHNVTSDKYVQAINIAMAIIPVKRGVGGIASLQARIGDTFSKILKTTDDILDREKANGQHPGEVELLDKANPALDQFKNLKETLTGSLIDPILKQIVEFCKLGGVEVEGDWSWDSLINGMASDDKEVAVVAADLSHPVFKLADYVKQAVHNLREEYIKPSDYIDRIYQRHTKPYDAYNECIRDIERLADFVGTNVPDDDFNEKSKEMSAYFNTMAKSWQDAMAKRNKSQAAMLKSAGPLQTGLVRGNIASRIFSGDVTETNRAEKTGVSHHISNSTNLATLRDGRELEEYNREINRNVVENYDDAQALKRAKDFEAASKNMVNLLKTVSNEFAVIQLQMLKLMFLTNADASYLFNTFSAITLFIGNNAKKIDDKAINNQEEVDSNCHYLIEQIKDFEERRPRHSLNSD